MNPIPSPNRQPKAKAALYPRDPAVLPPGLGQPPSHPQPQPFPPAAWTRVRLGWVAAAAVALGAVGYSLLPAGGKESEHPNWSAVREATARPPGEVRWQGADGFAFVPAIPFAEADRDPAATQAIRQAIESGDDEKIEQAVQRAQVNAPAPPPPPTSGPVVQAVKPEPKPQPTPPPAPSEPSLTPGMKAEIRKGDTEFFHLFLYDSCDEDGDVVDVLLNGHLFRTVKLTNGGVTLSVPLAADGSTKIALRGVRDGGGGITVACRTSRGHGFLRVMGVGEIQTLGSVRK